MDENKYLEAIEEAHRSRCGSNKKFCYVETSWHGSITHYQLSIVEEGVGGHFPLSEDVCLGTYQEARQLAIQLNRERLDVLPKHAAQIVASSMAVLRRE
jgi:hypothetical protein